MTNFHSTIQLTSIHKNSAAAAKFQKFHNDINFKLERRTKRNQVKNQNVGMVLWKWNLNKWGVSVGLDSSGSGHNSTQAHTDMVMQLQVPLNTVNFFINWVTSSFSRRVLLHEIKYRFYNNRIYVILLRWRYKNHYTHSYFKKKKASPCWSWFNVLQTWIAVSWFSN
jgi:hypothetical protein